MKSALARTIQSPFIRHNLIFFVGSGLSSVINYLYYPILGRLLSVSLFGEVQALLSLFTEVAILFGGVSLVAANISANDHDPERRNRLISELQKLTLGVMALITLIGLLSLPVLQRFFQLGSGWPIVAVLITLLIGVPITFGQAYLQGRQRFGESSIINIAGSTLKLVLSIALVLLGFKVMGALGGFVLSQLLLWLYVRGRASRAGLRWPAHERWRLVDLKVIKTELRYTGLVVIVSLVSTLLYSGDILVIKHYFSPSQAGAYAGIAVVGRIIFFLTGSIAGVMFPAIKRESSPSQNHRILAASIGLTILLGGFTLALFSLAPHFIINLLLGPRYLDLAFLLPKLSLVLFIISLTNLLFLYHLALRRRFIVFVAIAGGVLTFSLVLLDHATIPQVITSLLKGSTLTLILAACLPLLYRRPKLTNH